MKWWWCPLCTRPTHTELYFNRGNSRDNNPCIGICCSIRRNYSDSEPANLCSYSLMMCAWWISNKYQCFTSLIWLDPIGVLIRDLPHSIQSHHAIHYTINAVTSFVSYKKQELLLPFASASAWVHYRFFGMVHIAHFFSFCVVLLCVFMWVPSCEVRYYFRLK